MDDWHIRPASADDLDRLLGLAAELERYHDNLSGRETDPSRAIESARRDFEERLTNPDHRVFVAEADGSVLGMASAESRRRRRWADPHGYIADVFVLEPYRGRGIGRALVAAAEGWLGSSGYREIRVNVHPRNDRALRLYQRLGWSEVAINMGKELPRPSSKDRRGQQ